MDASELVSVSLREPVVDYVYEVLIVAFADEEVLGLYVSVDEVVVVEVLDTVDLFFSLLIN